MSRGNPFHKKTSKDEILEVLTKIVKENLEENKILITLNSLVSHFEIKKDIEISTTTLRRYGVNEDGYFIKKYPEVFDYKTDSRSNRGLIIDVINFLKKFEDKFDEKQIQTVEKS